MTETGGIVAEGMLCRMYQRVFHRDNRNTVITIRPIALPFHQGIHSFGLTARARACDNKHRPSLALATLRFLCKLIVLSENVFCVLCVTWQVKQYATL